MRIFCIDNEWVATFANSHTRKFHDLFTLLEVARRLGPDVCIYAGATPRNLTPFCEFSSSQLAQLPHSVEEIRAYMYNNYPELFV